MKMVDENKTLLKLSGKKLIEVNRRNILLKIFGFQTFDPLTIQKRFV